LALDVLDIPVAHFPIVVAATTAGFAFLLVLDRDRVQSESYQRR